VFDTMKVSAGSTALQTLSNVNAAAGYQLKTVNLSAYAGRTISLSFAGAEDEFLQTSFVLERPVGHYDGRHVAVGTSPVTARPTSTPSPAPVACTSTGATALVGSPALGSVSAQGGAPSPR